MRKAELSSLNAEFPRSHGLRHRSLRRVRGFEACRMSCEMNAATERRRLLDSVLSNGFEDGRTIAEIATVLRLD